MKKNAFLRMAIHLALLMFAMLYGMLAYKLQIPPYALAKAGFDILLPDEDVRTLPKYNETAEEYTATDVEPLILITQADQVLQQRQALINFLWGKPELPATLPGSVVENFSDQRYEDVASIGRIDKVVINMEFGLESIVYHFIPKKPNNRVILYHQGHRGDFYLSKEQIAQFLDNGFAVLAFAMPLRGLNNTPPTVHLPRFGNLKITDHDQMKYLLPESGHPVQYFLEPVIVALNYLDDKFEYSDISMTGISGGGWTTVLAAAMDTRITNSFPTAATYPIYLKSNERRDWGDYEANTPELYRTVTYLELYVMGSHGSNRKQLQIVNKYDACCLWGTKSETYKDIVRARVNQLGDGEFELLLDDSHIEHKISPFAMERILREL